MFSPNLNGIWTLNWLPFSRLLSLIGTQNKSPVHWNDNYGCIAGKEGERWTHELSLSAKWEKTSKFSIQETCEWLSDATVLRRPLLHDFGSLGLQAQMLNQQEISKLALWHLSPQGGHSVTDAWQEVEGKGHGFLYSPIQANVLQ